MAATPARAAAQRRVERTMARTTPTIHNPTNFEPADYEVRGYYDAKRPEYVFGMPAEGYAEIVRLWEMDMADGFGPDWRSKIYRCTHCGNGHVRWITATTHTPTGEIVTF